MCDPFLIGIDETARIGSTLVFQAVNHSGPGHAIILKGVSRTLGQQIPLINDGWQNCHFYFDDFPIKTFINPHNPPNFFWIFTVTVGSFLRRRRSSSTSWAPESPAEELSGEVLPDCHWGEWQDPWSISPLLEGPVGGSQGNIPTQPTQPWVKNHETYGGFL